MTLLLLFNQPPAAPAYLRVDADDSISDWLTHTGSNTNLYAVLDETTFDDADYIQSPAPPNTSVARFSLSNPTAGHSLSSPVIVRYRFKKMDTSDQKLTVVLKEGATPIATWTHTGGGLTTSFQTASQTLSGGEVASISDFDDLYIEFQAGPP
jgi:hypothetical protein